MRVGLVLGGGGPVGMAFHAGALAVLEHDLGWDPREAEIIVGTSAGAIVGSMLRRGIPAADLAALSVGAPTRSTSEEMRAAVAERGELPGMGMRGFLRLPRLPNPSLVARWAMRPWRLDPVLAFAGHVADGRVDLLEHGADHASAMGDDWPERPLWLCAVRQHDLRRVVFGRDATPALPAAVMASCSVPGYFRPVAVDGETFIDGGIRSPTNADVLRGEDLDLVIVISPMSGTELPRRGLGSMIRRYAKAKVDAEAATLLLRGLPAVVIEPGPELAPVMGTDFMSEERTAEIVTASFFDAGSQLVRPVTRTLLGGINRRAFERDRAADGVPVTDPPIGAPGAAAARGGA